jgi:hypothetical protein
MKPPRSFETPGNTQRHGVTPLKTWMLKQHRCVNLRADTSPTCLLIGVTSTSISPTYTVTSPEATNTPSPQPQNRLISLLSVLTNLWPKQTNHCVLFSLTFLYQLCLTFDLAEGCPSGSCWVLLPLRPLPLSAIVQPPTIVLDRPLLKWIQRCEIYKQLSRSAEEVLLKRADLNTCNDNKVGKVHTAQHSMCVLSAAVHGC